jgi:hypothetical protein
MERNAPPTCGRGLAANASLPATLAALMAARADVLERHGKALDLSDANSRRERDAYVGLERAHRTVARELADLADAMAGCRDLPMGRHDQAAMADPNGQQEAFRRFVALERKLVELLTANLEREEALSR